MIGNCRMYGCSERASRGVGHWAYCERHAREYEKRFGASLKAGAIKRLSKREG